MTSSTSSKKINRPSRPPVEPIIIPDNQQVTSTPPPNRNRPALPHSNSFKLRRTQTSPPVSSDVPFDHNAQAQHPATTNSESRKMPFTIAAFVTRKDGISPADFQTAYDTTHLPLLKNAVGDAYPQSVTRWYVKRAKSDPEGLKPLSFTGSEETFGYDLISYLTFEDEVRISPTSEDSLSRYANANE
jgi:hypothetical protein